MVKEETKTAFKVLHTLLWIFFTSYYYWGTNDVTVTDPIDESGWVPDGALINEIQSQPGQEQEALPAE